MELKNDNKPFLLIVDDEPVILDMLKAVLGLEYNIKCLEDGTSLSAELKNNPHKYDVCIVDVNLPGCRGDKAIDEARLFGIDMPVVFITSQAESSFKKPLNIPSTLMVKPFLPFEIRSIVRAMVKNYRRYSPSNWKMVEAEFDCAP